MAFFSYLQNVYVGEGIKDDEDFKYRLVKNIFRRANLQKPKYKSIVNAWIQGDLLLHILENS